MDKYFIFYCLGGFVIGWIIAEIQWRIRKRREDKYNPKMCAECFAVYARTATSCPECDSEETA